MLRLLGPGVRLCDGWNRREVMRIGGLGFLGAGLEPDRPAPGGSHGGRPERRATPRSAGPGRASSCS